jgi:hypothetical protein
MKALWDFSAFQPDDIMEKNTSKVRHDITEILLKVALDTIKPKPKTNQNLKTYTLYMCDTRCTLDVFFSMISSG